MGLCFLFPRCTNNTRIDFAISALTLVILAIPSFWVGILLIIFFPSYFPAVPLSGYTEPVENFFGFLAKLILPSVTLGLTLTASTTQVLRSATLEILGQDYIRSAKAKGLGERRVFLKHALRNALIPTVTIVAIQVGYLLGGSIIIERVFCIQARGYFCSRRCSPGIIRSFRLSCFFLPHFSFL